MIAEVSPINTHAPPLGPMGGNAAVSAGPAREQGQGGSWRGWEALGARLQAGWQRTRRCPVAARQRPGGYRSSTSLW